MTDQDQEKTSRPIREWVSIAQAERILGIPRTEINACIENAKLPFHQNGKRRIVNLKLIRAYFCRMDIENMKRTERAIAAQPLSQQKVTGNIGNHGKRQPRVRRVDL